MIAAVTTRIINASDYYEVRDAISHDLINNLSNQDITPLLIPNCNIAPKKLFKKIPFNFLLLSGGDDINLDPSKVKNNIMKGSSIRDYNEILYIDFCVKNKIPIIGICRGMQLINKCFGGNLIKTNKKEHVDRPHKILVLNNNIKIFPQEEFEVNSYHQNIITKKTISQEFAPFMLAGDDSVEGIFHKKHAIIGIMFHPEREFNDIYINNFFKYEFFKKLINALKEKK